MERWAALLLALCGFCTGRVVRVPTGPLLRVEGTEVVIPCEVSDYEGPSEQNFEWQFSLSGTLEDIVSTWDTAFTDPEYRERVRSKAIELRRVSNSVVTLHIHGIQGSDEGEYKCSTPSTDATVKGNYEASVHVRVIADALRLSRSKARSASSSPNITEGGDFQLQCLASTASAEHTHLSVSWEVKRDSAPVEKWQEVLSLGHDGTLHPGPGYEERSQEGGIWLYKAPGDSYRLAVSNALPEDGGTYRCVVQEWVQGVDESWQQIQQKELEITTVEVSPIALSVSLNESGVPLNRGDPLQLTCVVAAALNGMARTEVAWYRSLTPEDSLEGSQLLASVDHQSVVTEMARAHLSHVEPGSYRLTVAPTDEADEGFYFCRVGIWVPEGNGSWYKATEETSPPAAVVLSIAAPDFKVTLEATSSPLFSEDPTELVCRVSSAKLPSDMRFSVSWYHTPAQRSDDLAAPQLIATMDHDSVLQVEGKYHRRALSGDIVFFKPDVSSFTLRIRWTVDADRGNYNCIVAAWSSDGADRWTKSKVEESRPVNIFWPSEDHMLSVQALEDRPLSVPGSTFQMSCKVSPQNIKEPRFSVVVTVERTPSSSSKVVSLSQDSLVRVEDWKDLGRKDSVVLERVEENLFRFRLHHTQISDAGLYRCLVTSWTQGGAGEWQQAINATSNAIKVDFHTFSGGPVFNVSVHSDSPAVYHGERVELLCIVTIQGPALDPDDMSFDVSWFVKRSSALDTAAIFLASLDRHAVVTQAPRNGSSDVGVERVGAMEFRLRLYGCEEQDFGNHYCSVIPWVRSTNSWQQQPEVRSTAILVTVKADILSTFRYPLLIGAGFAIAIGLLSCLIGYCSTRLCCKKLPVQEVRRDQRRRLMSMEMD